LPFSVSDSAKREYKRDFNEERDINFRELFARLWQRRKWICGSPYFSRSHLLQLRFDDTVYRATTCWFRLPDRNRMGYLSSALGNWGIASLAGINVGSGDIEIEEALAVLRSRELTERFIANNNLMPILYSSNGTARRTRGMFLKRNSLLR